MKSLLLIRHGQAEHHIQEITGGWTDSGLTPTGFMQASLLADRLRLELDGAHLQLASSSLRRAIQTAEILGQVLNLQPMIYPELTDLNNGLAAGKTHVEARSLAKPTSEPMIDWQPYPEAESWRQFSSRVGNFMEQFVPKMDHTPIFISHAATIHVIITWWLQLPIEYNTVFGISPASITVLTHNHWNEPVLERLNDCAHIYTAGLADPIQL